MHCLSDFPSLCLVSPSPLLHVTPFFVSSPQMAVCLPACLCQSVPLSLCISICLSVCLSLSLSLFLCLCLSVSVCLSLSLSLFLFLCLSVSLCLYLCLCLTVSLYLYICFSVSVCLSVSPPSLSIASPHLPGIFDYESMIFFFNEHQDFYRPKL